MRKVVCAISLIALMAAGSSAFANGLKLNGLGSRAVTMGGAFVGLADDFSAFYWNPAGLGFMKNRILSFNVLDLIPSSTYRLSQPGLGTLVDAKSPAKHYLGGMGAYIQPIDDRLVAGIGIYSPAGFGSAWNAADLAYPSGNRTDIDWYSRVGLYTIAPTIAYQVNEKLSFGAQININYGFFNLGTYAGRAAWIPDTDVDLGQYEESLAGWGIGATIGVLFKPGERFSLGLTYRTSSTIRFSGDATMSILDFLSYPGLSEMERPVKWPSWLAAGVAFKPVDGLILTADIQYTDWKTIDVLPSTYRDPFWSKIMTLSGKTEMRMDWKSRVQIRAGAEYRLCPNWAARAGFYTDPAPAPDQTMTILLPNYDFTGLTAGFGRTVGGIQIDFGIEMLFGKERSIPLTSLLSAAGAMPGKYKMTIVAPTLSVSHRF